MARRPRVEYPGAFYHVITRGNNKKDIFLGKGDRRRFLDKVGKYKERYHFLLYAYTLMKNHIHLLIETGDVPLSKIMQGILQSHTQYHNKKYGTVGHLFQGRYKAILCDRDAYLLELVRYIHLNPVRARIVEDPTRYHWSSHRIFIGLEGGIVDYEFVLSLFHRSKERAVMLYENFVREGIGIGRREEFYLTQDQRFLGEEEFIEKVKSKAGDIEMREEVKKDKTLQDIQEIVEDITSVSKEELIGRSRAKTIVEARGLFAYLSRRYTKASNREIGDFLRRDPTIVSYLIRHKTVESWQRLIRKKNLP